MKDKSGIIEQELILLNNLLLVLFVIYEAF